MKRETTAIAYCFLQNLRGLSLSENLSILVAFFFLAFLMLVLLVVHVANSFSPSIREFVVKRVPSFPFCLLAFHLLPGSLITWKTVKSVILLPSL